MINYNATIDPTDRNNNLFKIITKTKTHQVVVKNIKQ